MGKFVAMTTPIYLKTVSSKSDYYLELLKIKSELDILLKDINDEERILKTLINTIVEKTCHYLNLILRSLRLRSIPYS